MTTPDQPNDRQRENPYEAPGEALEGGPRSPSNRRFFARVCYGTATAYLAFGAFCLIAILMPLPPQPPQDDNRSLGAVVGLVFVAVGAWLRWTGNSARRETSPSEMPPD
jgi:hypothetical protein